MKSEFNDVGTEFNKSINEVNPGLEAAKYYEVAPSGDELFLVKETSSDEGTQSASKQSVEDYQDFQEKMDNINRFNNTADGTQSPDMNSVNAANEAELVAEAQAGAATSASVSVSSTVASLAGSVSVITVAGVVVAIVAGGVMEKAPTIVSENYETGANYIKYEIDVTELSENMDYYIKVSNPSFSVEYPIIESGLQKQIVPDLKPYRNYEVSVISKEPTLGDIVYHTTTVSTSVLPKPVAVFEFTPNFDHILGKYDLEYETYISDYYNNSNNVYLQVYVGNKLIVDDHDLPENHFFRGTIKNITNSGAISAIVYGDYTDGKDWYYDSEIGKYGYEPDIPEGFEFRNDYRSLYTFDDNCFYKSFDSVNGTTLNVKTNFEAADEDDSYRIDILNNDEIIDSIVSTEKEVSFKIQPYIKNVDIKFTPLKNTDGGLVEFEASLVKGVDIDPNIFEKKEFRMYDGGYYFEAVCTNTTSFENEFDLTITLNNKDGSKTVENQKFTEVASVEGSQEGDVESYDILITYGDLIIEKIHIINEECFTLSSDFDIDDDGSVLVPFEVVLPEGAIFKSFTSYLNNNEVTFKDTTGTLKFDKLDTNTVSISGYLEYEYNGISFERNIYIENFDLGVDLRVSYYAPHLLSSYQYMDLKFEAYIKDKLVNFNFDPAFYNSDDEEMSFSPNEDIYRVSFDGNEIKYDLSSDGFEIDSLDLTNFDSDVCNSSNPDYDINFEKYTINNPVNYFKTINEDGTVNYYFDTNFTDTSTNSSYEHQYRIRYSYLNSNNERIYKYTDNTTAKTIKLENIKDLDYKFECQMFYHDLTYGFDYGIKVNESQYIPCELIESSSVFTANSISLANLRKDREYYTVIDFAVSYGLLDTSKEIEVLYKNNKILIPFKNETDEGVESNSSYYAYYYDNEDSSLGYKVMVFKNQNDDSIEHIMVEAYVKEAEDDFTYEATITVNSKLDVIIDKYVSDNGSDDIINSASAGGEANYNVGYKANYNIDSMSVTTEYNDYYGVNYINVSGIEFNSENDNDKLLIEAYSNGVLVGETTIGNGETSASIEVDPAYTNIEIVVSEYVIQHPQPFGGYEIEEVYTTKISEQDRQNVSVDPIDVVTNVSVTETADAIQFDVTAVDDFSEYNLKVTKYYYLITNGVKATTLSTDYTNGDVGSTTVSLTNEEAHAVSKYVIEVYRGDRVFAIYEMNLEPEIGNYTYVDGEDYITLPYNLKLPEGAALVSGTITAGIGDPDSIDSETGTITVTQLETNVIDIMFDITYELNGVQVQYSYTYTKELEGELDVDYTIYSYQGNSSYGDFSCNQDIKFDQETNKIYYYKNGSYYDDDGNEAPDSAVSSNYKNTIYVLKVEGMKVDIGCFKNLEYNSNYTLNVIKAGGNIINTSTGEIKYSYQINSNPPNIETSYLENSSQIQGIYITFLHTNKSIEYYNYDVYGINLCELEFSIIAGGNIVYSKSLEIDEPSKNTVVTESAFSIDRAAINNTVTTNSDDTINMTIDTGFDSAANPNYAYKVILYNRLDYYGYDSGEKLYESDYLTSDEVTINDLANTNYEVYIEVYYSKDGEYIKYNSYKLGNANSPFANANGWNYDSSTTSYTNTLYLDTNFINQDYLDGTKTLDIKIKGVTASIDLTDTEEQFVSTNTRVQVLNDNGVISVAIIGKTDSSYARGTVTISQGNASIGYVDVTYTI